MTILQEKNPRNKRPCHSLWCLRLPLSYMFGRTLQLMTTVWGALAGPKQTATLGRAICMVDGWLMVQKSSAAKKPCHCSEKEWPYFCILFSFWSSVTHAAALQAQENRVYCSQSDRLTAGLRLAGTSGDGLIQPPAQSKASYNSLLGAASSCVLTISKHGTPQPLWAACYLICTLYLQNPRVPLLCRNSKRHHSVASAETMLPFTSCVTVGGSRGHRSL